MLLKTFKEKNSLTYRQIAYMFDVTEKTVINWVQGAADIQGRKGEQEIIIKRRAARQVREAA